MDCCENKVREKNDVKGGNKIMEIKKKTLLWIVIGVLILVLIFMTFKGGGTQTVSAAQTATSAARSAASSGMVGGC